MPKIKNRLFQPISVLLPGGKSLYFQSRQEIEVSSADLDAPHLKTMMMDEDVMLWQSGALRGAKAREATPEQPQPSSHSEVNPESEPEPESKSEDQKSRSHGGRGSHKKTP